MLKFLSERGKVQNGNRLGPQELIQQLNLLCTEMLSLEASSSIDLAGVHPDHRASATNLIHYLALRRHDIRQLQDQLGALGLSLLGRTEPHVISALCAVINVLNQLAGSKDASPGPTGGGGAVAL